ncbi:MAG: dienelactone hydrolase family protein [Chitinophagaceae bacterium]|nr:dienelactone hydrolase family protein [Chitinophagaceae bacterium]
MDQKIINLFDEYTHKPLKREEFIRRLAKLTGSMAAALTVLPLLEVNYAKAAMVPEQDDDIVVEDVTYPGDGITMKGYVARPKGADKYGSVVVIHENRGLNPHIKDVARRVAKAGFVALAPDALSGTGGTPSNEDEAREEIGKLDAAKTLQNFLNGLKYVGSRSESNGKTGCVGFCWGGAMANQLAVNDPQLDAAVAFYGRQPASVDVKKIKARVQLHYGGLDERVNQGIPEYEKALKDAGIKYELFIYEGAQHAFNNDTAPTRYNEAAAKLAWERTIKLFKEVVG